MQFINLNKTLDLGNSIEDLLLISIDDQIDMTDDKEGVKIIGNIAISGTARTIEGEKKFSDSVDLDIFLTHDEIVERNSLNITVGDFSYNIEDNKLLLNISLKLDGLKEIETTFLAQEDNETDEKETLEELEVENNVYIDIDVDINERGENIKEISEDVKDEEIEENTLNEEFIEEINVNEELSELAETKTIRKSLLKSVFSTRKINEEVSWKLHCVKNESSYEEIANKYKVNLKKLESLNNNEKLSEGKLIFIPLD